MGKTWGGKHGKTWGQTGRFLNRESNENTFRLSPGSRQMTDKEQFDSLMKLAELQSSIRESRREIEFKVSVGLWAITAGAIAYLRGNLQGRAVWWALALLVVIVAMHSLLWVRANFNSSERDAKQVYYYMHHAARLVLRDCVNSPGNKLPFPKFGPVDFLKHQPLWFEVAVTPILGLLVLFIARLKGH